MSKSKKTPAELRVFRAKSALRGLIVEYGLGRTWPKWCSIQRAINELEHAVREDQEIKACRR